MNINSKSKSKLTSKQSKKDVISLDKKHEISVEKDKPPVLCSSETQYNLPDTPSHCEVSVPSPDDAALPNPSLCPVISIESKGANSVSKVEENCDSSKDQKDNEGSSENKADGQGKKVPDVKDKNVPLTKNSSDVKDKKKVPSAKTKNSDKELKNKLLTDYYQVRRSSRKILWSLQSQKQKFVEEAILSGTEEGFEVKEFADKGRGVITKKEIKRGEFVLEYSGELLSFSEARERELLYATQEDIGCYMYYFKHKDKQFCVDATKESGRLGRLVNHSKKGNLRTQQFFIDDYPHLIFVATRDISPGEELLYDYGDRSKKSLLSYPWLAN